MPPILNWLILILAVIVPGGLIIYFGWKSWESRQERREAYKEYRREGKVAKTGKIPTGYTGERIKLINKYQRRVARDKELRKFRKARRKELTKPLVPKKIPRKKS
jgi:predicted negative regulator of RcsB-dependent stress response